jgi:general secretion pathway protein A
MYTNYYGIYLNPFENTPDPRFLFPSKSHREVLAALRYGVDSAKGFILLAGDVGTGKTTMVNALLKEIDPSFIILNITNPKWTFVEIIRYLAVKLEIDAKGKENFQILEELQTELEKLDDQGKRVVLIIDEAHLLSESALEDIRLLSNIESNNKKLIQIVLVGQEEIYQTLRKDSLKTLKQRISINRHLQPLNPKETTDYINHRLQVAGRQSQLFSPKARALIWKRSQGVPRLINHICDNAMLIGYAAEAKLIGSGLIREVVMDMDSGHKNLKTHKFVQIRNLKWAGATLVILFLSVIIVKYFPVHELILANNVPENKMISTRQPQESVMTQLDSQKPLAPAPQKTPEIKRAPESDHSDAVMSKNLSDAENSKSEAFEKTTVETAQNADSEEPRELIPAMMQNPENLDMVNETQQFSVTTKMVEPNDSLSSMARKKYGFSNHTILDLIHMANPEIKDIHQIYTGQVVNMPLVQKKDLIHKDKMGNYYIHYASFYEVEAAWQCLRNLRHKDQKSFVIPTRQQKNEVYRVYYGNYKSLAEAQKEIENLRFWYLSFTN